MILKKKDFFDVFSYIEARVKVFKKLSRYKDLVAIAQKRIPNFDYETLKNRGYLTKQEINLLILLNKYHNETDINTDKLAKSCGYNSVKRFLTVKDNLFRKLRKTPILLEEALSYYKEIEVSKKPVEIKEQDNEKLLTDKEILEEALKYCSDPSTLLKVLNRHKNSPLSNEEMIEKLHLNNPFDYLVLRYILFQKIKDSETLKIEALEIFPDLDNYIDLEKGSIKITFSNNEVNYLREICLVKDNHLVYQTRREISSKLAISCDDARKYERNSLTKIINSIDEGNDLNITLWPNFLEEFMIRDNFRKTISVKISEKDLENIKAKDSKGKILKGIKALEQSVFRNYVSTCSDLEKKILALSLGYFDCKFFSSEEVANIMNVSIESVINLTKSCLECSKDEYFRGKKVLCKGREKQNV